MALARVDRKFGQLAVGGGLDVAVVLQASEITHGGKVNFT